MSRTERTIAASPEQVFAVLADGWSYSDWVVGTAHIRHVDPEWPAPGSRLRHTVGPWPLTLRDETVSLACDPPHRLVLQPKLWPLGELTVTFTVTPVVNNHTRVTITEEVSEGPVRWVRSKLNDVLLHYRNREVLRRLADFAERRETGG